MKKYKLYWLDGKTEIIEGYDAVDAFNRAGIGRGALDKSLCVLQKIKLWITEIVIS